MKIRISRHAQQRMSERGIQEDEILEAFNFPDKKGQRGESKVILKKRKSGHLLIIYYSEHDDCRNLVTVIDTSKVTKYL